MNRCILHVGLPKTGTTAIQRFLRYGLTDPGFHYGELGEVGTGRALAVLFGSPEDRAVKNTAMGWSDRKMAGYRRRMEREWTRTLEVASRRHATLVLSTEFCWEMSAVGLDRLRRRLVSGGYEVSVLVYLRPWKAWLESMAQQGLKGVHGHFTPDLPWAWKDFRGRIQLLDELFGRPFVQVAKYDPAVFESACVVQDFCTRLGIRQAGIRSYRVHESLRLPALRLLHAYRRFGPGFGTGLSALQENRRLTHRLTQLDGPPLRFHSSLVAPILADLTPQRDWLEKRLGATFQEDIFRDDSGPCIRAAEELLRFSPSELAWLSERTGLPQIPTGDGVAVARQVAVQLHRLRLLSVSSSAARRFPAWSDWWQRLLAAFDRSG
ncbi:MAG: hypothetical protein RLY31_181 [Bacteroidota bacterium]|jgi:hypothetical protein